METIKLELTVEEANAILASLGQQPYIKVVDIIRKIQQQGREQMPVVSEANVHPESEFSTAAMTHE